MLGIALYILLNWSYTAAVFTSPGTTTYNNGDYGSLPTQAPPVATNFTVKSNGELRFCKKCQARKPDRAHHCSTCRRCVLKMDHHCPWLATCVGLRNYKAFLLFLIYTTLFCFVCFAVSTNWVYREVLSDGATPDSIMPVHYVMLAVIAGIIGLVLAGFTGWHILLASRGQTTIECLEKTRYLSPLRKSMQHQHFLQHEGQSHGEPLSYGQQLKDIHTNALPGVTRPEEGDATIDGSGEAPYHQSYDDMERYRARERYEEYLDEQDSDKLPSAFDLGWRKNLLHLFGERPLLWPIPICTTSGNGWSWEPSPKWLAAREKIAREREEQTRREHAAGWGTTHPAYASDMIPPVQSEGAGRHYVNPSRPGYGNERSTSKADKILGRAPSQYVDSPQGRRQSTVSMRTLRPQDSDLDDDPYDISSDEEEAEQQHDPPIAGRNNSGIWGTATTVSSASRLLSNDTTTPGKQKEWTRWDEEADGGVD
jgi:ribosomal protein L40E